MGSHTLITIHSTKVIMETKLIVFTVLLSRVNNVKKYDFGIFENEILLKALQSEDILLTSKLEEYNLRLKSEDISKFLKEELQLYSESAVHHPVNAFHLIRKYSRTFPELINRTRRAEVRTELEGLRDTTELIREEFTSAQYDSNST